MEKCEICGSPTRYAEYYGEPPIVCTNPKCENASHHVRSQKQGIKRAYYIGTIIWLFIVINLIISGYNQGNDIFAYFGKAIALYFAFIGTILYLVYLLLVFLFNRNRTAFGIALVLFLFLGLWFLLDR